MTTTIREIYYRYQGDAEYGLGKRTKALERTVSTIDPTLQQGSGILLEKEPDTTELYRFYFEIRHTTRTVDIMRNNLTCNVVHMHDPFTVLMEAVRITNGEKQSLSMDEALAAI